ncbi:MAG: SHOCT domain-containing protein [Saccharothrix sp.]|nr:SHOCT domain-containing protein [Saccharothrix sp.]
MHWYNSYGAAYGGMALMFLVGLIVLGGVVALVVVATRRPHEDPNPALRILAARLAKGEIDADEFERVRNLLRAP